MPLDATNPHGTRRRWRLVAALVSAVLAACNAAPSKEAEEAAKNTFACQLAGAATGRLLMGMEAPLSVADMTPMRRSAHGSPAPGASRSRSVLQAQK